LPSPWTQTSPATLINTTFGVAFINSRSRAGLFGRLNCFWQSQTKLT
jgi:hypothetical protein